MQHARSYRLTDLLRRASVPFLFVLSVLLPNLASGQGSIRITVDSKPNNGQDFSYTWTAPIVAPLVNSILDDDTNAARANSVLFNAVPAGTHTVTQNQPGNWRLNNIVCTGDIDGGSIIDLTLRRVVFDLDSGEDIVCTFTNWLLPGLRLQKRTFGGTGTFTFTASNVDMNLGVAGVQTTGSITTTAVNVDTRFDGNTVTGGVQDALVTAFGAPIVITESATVGFQMLVATPNCTYTGGTLTTTPTDNAINSGAVAGTQTVTTFVPGDTGSTLIVCTFHNGSIADIAISKSNSASSVISGTQTTYAITVSNNGPGPANATTFRDPAAAFLNCTAGPITCTATGGAVCPVTLTVAQLQAVAGLNIPTFPAGSTVTVNLTCAVTGP